MEAFVRSSPTRPVLAMLKAGCFGPNLSRRTADGRRHRRCGMRGRRLAWAEGRKLSAFLGSCGLDYRADNFQIDCARREGGGFIQAFGRRVPSRSDILDEMSPWCLDMLPMNRVSDSQPRLSQVDQDSWPSRSALAALRQALDMTWRSGRKGLV